MVHITRVSCANTIFQMICSGGISNRSGKNNCNHSHFSQFQIAASTVLIQQVPFSFSRYRFLAYILMSGYLLFTTFALLFSLVTTHKRLVQPNRGFQRLCWYSETFLRPFFFIPVHTQSIPRSRDAASLDENLKFTMRRVRHLERTVPGRYLRSYHTVAKVSGGDALILAAGVTVSLMLGASAYTMFKENNQNLMSKHVSENNWLLLENNYWIYTCGL